MKKPEERLVYESIRSIELFPAAFPENIEADTAVEDYANSIAKQEIIKLKEVEKLKPKPKKKFPFLKEGSEKSFFKDQELKKVRYDLKPIFAAELSSYQFGLENTPSPAKRVLMTVERKCSLKVEKTLLLTPRK